MTSVCCVNEDIEGILPRNILFFLYFFGSCNNSNLCMRHQMSQRHRGAGPRGQKAGHRGQGERRQGAGHKEQGENATSRVQGVMSRATVHY